MDERIVNTQPRIIGLMGYGGAGKDSAAHIIVKYGGYEKRAFADKVREFAVAIDAHLPEIQETYSQVVNRLGYDQAKREHKCVREYLVRIGHSARTVIYKEIWLDAVLPPTYNDETRRIVVSDVRYPNEADRVRALGGAVWRIERPNCDAVHETERQSIAAAKYDLVLLNDGTLEDLERKVNNLLLGK